MVQKNCVFRSNTKFLHHKRIISPFIRIFLSATLEFDKGASLIIKKGIKVRERAVIAVREQGKLTLDRNVSIGMDCKIIVHESLTIGEGTLLSPNVFVYDHDHKFSSESGIRRKEFNTSPIVIGKNCWIGSNTVVLNGTIIGDNCIVGSGSVIKGKFPSNSMILQKRETTVYELITC